MIQFVHINVQPHGNEFVVELNSEFLMGSNGKKMTFPTAQEAGEAAEAVQKAMDAWNTLTDDQRAAALKAADTAIPAVAMAHFGFHTALAKALEKK